MSNFEISVWRTAHNLFMRNRNTFLDFRRRSVRGLCAIAAGAGLIATSVPAAVADPFAPARDALAEGSAEFGSSGLAPSVQNGDTDPFYETEGLAAGAPGEVLRTLQAPYAPVFNGLDFSVPDTAEKIMYSTTDTHGRSVPVSGYVVEPTVPWTGAGERPTVVIGRGTIGQGDQCAPSRNWPLDNQPDPLQSGRKVALEGLYDWVFATAGVRVVVTDYIGMGTPGIHTYMNRAEQAHAMLDAARAARNLVGERGGQFGKVAFYGHSQGGGASASAAASASEYAPDLDVAGTYSSAPPADLNAVQRHIDGSDLTGAIGFTINGLVDRYPDLESDLAANLSPAGYDALDELSTMCTDEINDAYGGRTTAEWTLSGQKLDELLDEIPAGRAAMEEQRLGERAPEAPSMIVAGPHDPTVDYQQSKDLAGLWCSAGANVVYRDDFMPPIGDYNHFIQAASGAPFGVGFLLDRFNGLPVAGGCH